MSMLYLKSQVNPHFLYNTLDTIRIQAQLNGDKKVADLLMRLVDFFRISVKVDRQMVALDDQLEMCIRDSLMSANEAFNGVAEHVAGSIDNFVAMMNQKEKELGCTGTHFANANGLWMSNHYKTAHDMALI